MWNEFEHVEDDRYDPDRDGYYGEYKKYNSYGDSDYSSDETENGELRRKRWYEK